MADFPLQTGWVDLVTDQNVSVRAWRSLAPVRYETIGGTYVDFNCLADSGAPISVLPYSLWHGRHLQWTKLGSTLTRTHGGKPESLEWQGIPCLLGVTSVVLYDPQPDIELGPFWLVGKFVQSKHSRRDLELTALLGLNFLTDNEQELILSGMSHILSGRLSTR